MKELLRTVDPTLVPYVSALLAGEDIDCFVLDVNMSVLEGSLGILPRRIMVRAEDYINAQKILRDNNVPFSGNAI